MMMIIILIIIVVTGNGLCCIHSAEIMAIKQGAAGIRELFIIIIPMVPQCALGKKPQTLWEVNVSTLLPFPKG